MILHRVELGQGPPVVMLHGLFGTAANFGVVQRRLAPECRVLAFDLRNHGSSPHDPAMTYPLMAADVAETMAAAGLKRAAVIGHSMGGKVAMTLALTRPDLVSRLMVADIAPAAYPPHLHEMAAAMQAIPLQPGLTRADVDAALSGAVHEARVLAFLSLNLRLGAAPAWRIGLDEIAAALPAIEGWDGTGAYEGPTLVLAGERSDYIRPEHRPVFQALFPHARFATLRGAGHWLHAEAPEAFIATAQAFLAPEQVIARSA